MQVRFSGTHVLFVGTKVWFDPACCNACPGHHSGIPTPCTLPTSGLPSCVRLSNADFQSCVACDVFTDCGTTLLWDGILTFDLSAAWNTAGYTSGAVYCTTTFKRIRVDISFAPAECLFRLTVSCYAGTTSYVIWQGEKSTGDSPCGVYIRTSGCDTTPIMTVG